MFLEWLKGILSGFIVTILVISFFVGMVFLFFWRRYKKWKAEDTMGKIEMMEKVDEVVQKSDTIQQVEYKDTEISFVAKKDESKKTKERYPHKYPDIVPKEPYEVIAKFDLDGEIIQKSYLPYNIRANVKGENLYFEFNFVPDKFKKTKLRVPLDGFDVKEGQVLGWIGEGNDFFVFIARVLSIFRFRLNVLNKKVEIKSPVNGMIHGKFVEHLERIDEGENLLCIWYEKPSSEIKKE